MRLAKIQDLFTTKNVVFAVAFAIFLGLQLWITAGPMLERQVPVEADDAYGYIVKAEEMRSCFLQDCAALVDLRQQFTAPSSDPDGAYTKAREYHRIFVIYHPLQSAALLLLNTVGFSQELAYSLIAVLAKALLCVGIAYWLSGIFGRLGAAFSLLLLAPAIFLGTGLHTMVPSAMALALATLLWGLILHKHPRLGVLLVPLVIALFLLHEIGRLYAGIALVVYLFNSPRPWKPAVIRTAGIVAGLIVLAFIVPLLVQQPELRFDPTEFYPGPWDYVAELAAAVPRSLNIILIWLNSFLHPLVALVLIAAGIISLPKTRQANWAAMLVLLLGFAGLSFIYVVPWFGALAFERAWVPFALFLVGTIGYGFSSGLQFLIELIKQFSKEKMATNKLIKEDRVGLGAAILSLLLVPTVLLSYLPFQTLHFGLTFTNQAERQDIFLDSSQPAYAFGAGQNTVAYTAEIPMYFYLANGGLHHGAVYLPAISGPQKIQEALSNADFVVSRNPMFGLSEEAEYGFALDDFAYLTIESHEQVETLRIFAETRESAILLINWVGTSSQKTTTVEIPEQHTGWVTFTSPGYAAERIELRLETASAVRIRGLSFDEQAQTNWPWGAGVTLTITLTEGEIKTILLDPSALVESNAQLEVVDDDGYTLLARVIR